MHDEKACCRKNILIAVFIKLNMETTKGNKV